MKITLTGTVLLLCNLSLMSVVMTCPGKCDCQQDNKHVMCSGQSLLFFPRYLPVTTTTVDFSDNFLGPIINGSWSYIQNLTEINLSNNRITRIVGCSFKGLFNLKKLNLQSNNLRNLQEDLFSDNDKMEVLDLSHNLLENLQDPVFKYLKNLKILYLSHNRFTELKLGLRFQVLTQLEQLDLSHNNFGHVSSNAFEMFDRFDSTCERRLSLAFCQIKSIENGTMSLYKGLSALDLSGNHEMPTENISCIFHNLQRTNLKSVDLSYMHLSTVETLFTSSHYLALLHLNLSHNSIYNISTEAMATLGSLHYLDISFNSINVLQPGFSHLVNLKCLNISHNQLQEFRGNVVEHFSGLEILTASYNNIENRTNIDLSPLQFLKVLDLSHNKIDGLVLPGNVQSLEEINLAGNRISSLELIPNAKNLLVFDISENRLTMIGPFVFQSAQNITIARFGGNMIYEIDHKAFLPNTPHIIDVSRNRLTEVHYCNWAKARELNLSDNSISDVNYQAFHAMSELDILDLSQNHIETLHEDTFKYLTNLKQLQLSQNHLQTHYVKKEDFFYLFRSLESLKILDMSYNNLSYINASALRNSRHVEVISLASNRFHTIYPELFIHLKKLHELDLSDNPFDCDCNLLPLIEWIDSSDLLLLMQSNMSYTCHAPWHRKEKNIMDFEYDQFECNKNLLYLIIFGSLGGFVILIGIAGSFVCHYYRKWSEKMQKDKATPPKDRRIKTDRVRVTGKHSNIEELSDDFMMDLDKHIKMKLKAPQNGGSKVVSNGIPPLVDKRSKNHKKDKMKQEKDKKKPKDKKNRKDKSHRSKHEEKSHSRSKSENDDKHRDRTKRHRKKHPERYYTLDNYQPTNRWDALGRDRWAVLQWDMWRRHSHDPRNPEKFHTLPTPKRMSQEKIRSHRAPREVTFGSLKGKYRSYSNQELPDGRFFRRNMLDPRLQRAKSEMFDYHHRNDRDRNTMPDFPQKSQLRDPRYHPIKPFISDYRYKTIETNTRHQRRDRYIPDFRLEDRESNMHVYDHTIKRNNMVHSRDKRMDEKAYLQYVHDCESELYRGEKQILDSKNAQKKGQFIPRYWQTENGVSVPYFHREVEESWVPQKKEDKYHQRASGEPQADHLYSRDNLKHIPKSMTKGYDFTDQRNDIQNIQAVDNFPSSKSDKENRQNGQIQSERSAFQARYHSDSRKPRPLTEDKGVPPSTPKPTTSDNQEQGVIRNNRRQEIEAEINLPVTKREDTERKTPDPDYPNDDTPFDWV